MRIVNFRKLSLSQHSLNRLQSTIDNDYVNELNNRYLKFELKHKMKLVCCGHHKTFCYLNQPQKFNISSEFFLRFYSIEAEIRLSAVLEK